MSDIELELKRQFTELRASDEANAPAYEVVRDRGRDHIRETAARSRSRWIAPALLASAAGFVAMWAMMRVSARGERAQREAWVRDSSHVFRWTMPTDVLLTSARQTLQTPPLVGSVLDAAAVPIPGTPIKGD